MKIVSTCHPISIIIFYLQITTLGVGGEKKGPKPTKVILSVTGT
jgi:hypothetical protein